MRRRRALLLVAAAVAPASCGDDESTAPAITATSTSTTATAPVVEEPEPVGGIIGTIGTNRLYALERGFGLGLRNVGDEPVTVRQVQLDSPLFESVPLADEEVLLMPGGRRFVLPVPYGEAVCDGDAAASFGAVVVVDDGEELRLPVVVEDDPGAIGRVHAGECAAAELLDAADLRFDDEWTRDGESVHGELVLEQRRAGATVAVDDAVGSVIFTIRVDGDDRPILRVDDGDPHAAVPVTISGDRCDPHALAESKRTFTFLAWATLDGGDSVPIELEPTGPARAALEEVLTVCRG